MTEAADFKQRDQVFQRFSAHVPKDFYPSTRRAHSTPPVEQPLRWSVRRRMVRPRRLKVV